MLKSLYIALVYIPFAVIGFLPASGDCAMPSNETSSCCCASSGACTPDLPMDCCVDDSEESPSFEQILPIGQRLFVSPITAEKPIAFTSSLVKAHFIDIETWYPPPNQPKVYLSLHKLILYA